MAGINRLGKGPPKPGSYRPPDPNKYRTMDMYSEGAEGDADYMRMVQDIEDTQQNQVGWLFGRGAFDKGDLLYLRDEEEKRRFKETELRDSERIRFMALRAGADSHRDPPAPTPSQAAPPGTSDGPSAGLLRDRHKPSKPTARLMPVAVKPRPAAGSASGAMPRPSSASPAPLGTSRPPSGKRPPSASPSQPAAASVAAMSAAAESGTPAWNVGAKRARLDDDQHSAAAAGQSTSSAQKAAEGLASHGADDQEAAAGGLSSLLGGYGSGSDDSDAEATAAAADAEEAQPAEASAGLPNG